MSPRIWSLALLLAGSQSAACDQKQGSKSESSGNASTGEVKGAGSSSNGAQSSTKKAEPGPKAEPSYRIVANRGGGSGCKLGEGGDATAIVTNAEPNGPVNYGQWTFDALGLNAGEDKKTTDCTLTLELTWTPGYRVRVQGTELSAFIEHIPPENKDESDKGKPKDDKGVGKGKREELTDGFWRATHFAFSNQAPLATEFLSEGRFEGESTELGAMGMVSDCSGRGEWTAKLELGVSAKTQSQYALSYDVFSVLFDGLEKCP